MPGCLTLRKNPSARSLVSHSAGSSHGAKTRLLREGSGELGRHHFAFLRALLDGVDLERAWRLYLSFTGGPSDRRHFATRLRLVVAAIEHAGEARGCGSELAVALPALRALGREQRASPRPCSDSRLRARLVRRRLASAPRTLALPVVSRPSAFDYATEQMPQAVTNGCGLVLNLACLTVTTSMATLAFA